MRVRHLLAAAALLAPLASSQDPIGADRIRPIRVPTQPPVHVSGLDVDLSVSGPAMRVTQRVTLTNPGTVDQEFDLVFPLGTESVVSGIELRMGDSVLEGMTYSADDARRIYMEITRRRRDPALLEHYGEAMFRARVFPIPAGGSQTLVLSYTRVVQPEGDLMKLHLPLTAFRAVSKDAKLTVTGELVTLHPVATLYSPTHELDHGSIEELGAEPPRYRTTFEVTEEVARGDLDFLAYFKARAEGGLLDVTILSERPDPSEDGYFLAVVNGVPTEDLAPEPKDVVFVIDRSGSMQGKKVEQAREALKFLVERLRPEDRFNIVSYAATADVFAKELRAPSPELIAATSLYIDGIRAEGGTNIEAALALALGQLGREEGRVAQVVFLTDGLPTVGEEDTLKLVQQSEELNAADARIVAFGVGFDVNGHFLDRLATRNKGLSEYVLPSDNIEEKVPGFYSRMSSPLVLDAALAIEGPHVYDVFPRETGDLYGGHQTLIVGRYRGAGDAALRVTGRRGGQPFEQTFTARFAEDAASSGSRDLVARIWAAKKVGFLVDEIRLNGTNEELVQAVVQLGTRFGILTEYTSFLAAPETDLLAADEDDFFLGAFERFEEAREAETGADGVSQAAESKFRQRGRRVQAGNEYFDNGKKVVIDTVVTTGGKTLFLKDQVWQDSAVTKAEADRTVELYSDAFFALLDVHPWLGTCLARTGPAVIQVGAETIAFTAQPAQED